MMVRSRQQQHRSQLYQVEEHPQVARCLRLQ